MCEPCYEESFENSKVKCPLGHLRFGQKDPRYRAIDHEVEIQLRYALSANMMIPIRCESHRDRFANFLHWPSRAMMC